jgi:eukaryotic-like serine/threonine-protein kinase
MTDWKLLELFEREGKILAQLNHPAIPRYLDYFQVDSNDDKLFCLVQELAPGQSLATWIEQGWQPTEVDVKAIALQVLEILIYLQTLTPPIIHRDIKPENIIRQANGQLYLVDFGGVQDTYRHTITRNSTVVGTFGYMAPEQFRGQAVLATDLYGLGATLLFLLTRKSPADLPQHQLKIRFRSHIQLSKAFANWLEKLIEPAIDDRFPSAEAALAVLQGRESLEHFINPKPRRPRNSGITLTQTEEQFVVEIPPVGFNSTTMAIALLLLVSNGFLLQTARFMLESSKINFLPGFFFFLFLCHYAPFGLRLLNSFLLSPMTHTYLLIDADRFQFRRKLLSCCIQSVQGHISNLSQLGLESIGVPQRYNIALTAHSRKKLHTYRLGSSLTQPEQEWLIGSVRTWLEKQRKTILSSKLTERNIVRRSLNWAVRSGIIAFGIAFLGTARIRYPATGSTSSPTQILYFFVVWIAISGIVGGGAGVINVVLYKLFTAVCDQTRHRKSYLIGSKNRPQ